MKETEMRYWVWFLISFGIWGFVLGVSDDNAWLRVGAVGMFSAGVWLVTSAVWPARKAQR